MALSSAGFNNNRISIITKANLRYEGILYNINAEDQQITLTQVRSFGTEGRRPGNEIGPTPDIHEYIVFKGSDIKDLKVLENQPVVEKKTEVPEKPVQPEVSKSPISKSNEPIEIGKDTMQLQQNSATSPEQEFDFTAMNEKFQSMTMNTNENPNIKSGYMKDDFFDSISSSTIEKTRETYQERMHQKEINKETFGQDYVDQGRRGGGNYSGGFRKKNYYHHGGYGGNQGGYGGNQGGYGGNTGGGGMGGQRYKNYGDRSYGGGQQGGIKKQYNNKPQGGGSTYYQDKKGGTGGGGYNGGPKTYYTSKPNPNDQYY